MAGRVLYVPENTASGARSVLLDQLRFEQRGQVVSPVLSALRERCHGRTQPAARADPPGASGQRIARFARDATTSVAGRSLRSVPEAPGSPGPKRDKRWRRGHMHFSPERRPSGAWPSEARPQASGEHRDPRAAREPHARNGRSRAKRGATDARRERSERLGDGRAATAGSRESGSASTRTANAVSREHAEVPRAQRAGRR